MRFTIYTIGFIFLVSFNACQNSESSATSGDSAAMKKQMETLAADLVIEKDGIKSVNKHNALELIKVYENYIETAKINRTEKVEYLFKAHDVSKMLRDTDKALAYLNRITTEFRDNPKSANALFLQGFIYDSELQDYDKAAEYYSVFLRRFPDHELASNAITSLKFLGLSDEEQLQKILEENKKAE